MAEFVKTQLHWWIIFIFKCVHECSYW